MTNLDWVIFIAAWMLIPVALVLKYWLDGRTAKVWQETQAEIDKGIQDLKKKHNE